MKVSVIICTKNRAADLEQTLQSLDAVQLDAGGVASAELLIVDNGSSDHTAQVAQTASLRDFLVRYVREDRGAKARAINTGIREATGDVLVFSDDDVRFPQAWLSGLLLPLRDGTADIVAGGVRLAPHLLRSWMNPRQMGMLADTTTWKEVKLAVGANMAFRREILSRVPAFDVELGPGALGFCEDLLFSFQLKEAGFRLGVAFGDDATVIHHFDPARLSRADFVRRLGKEGRCLAYIDYHWSHRQVEMPLRSAIKRRLRLMTMKAQGKDRDEMPSEAVMNVMQDVAYFDMLHRLGNQPRNYTQRGLVKIAGVPNEP